MTEVDEVLASGGEAVSDQRNGAPHVAAHGGHVGALVTHRLHTLPGCLEGGGGGRGQLQDTASPQRKWMSLPYYHKHAQ